MGWLSGYAYRKKVTISGSSGAGTNYQVKLSIGSSSGGDFHLEGHCEDFPNDICFTKDDGLSLLSYWIEDPSQDPVTVWVKIEDSLDDNRDIYCYYGSSLASSLSNGKEAFPQFFDDFNTTGLGFVEKWNSGVIASGYVRPNRNILIDGNYLYAVSGHQKLVIYDISDPENPVQKSITNTSYANIDVRKKGNYLFVSNSDGVDVWDVSDVENPTLNNHISYGTWVHGMFLDGDYLYCCQHKANKFQIVDVSDPTNPVNKGSLSGATYFNGIHDCHVDGNYAYVANYLAEAGQYGFVVVDVSDKDNPSVAAYGGEGHHGSHIIKMGNYCYVGTHDPGDPVGKGITVWEVSDPTNPVYEGRFFTNYGYAVGYWFDDYNSTTLGAVQAKNKKKLLLIDISTPDSPTIVAEKNTPYNILNVAITGDYFFVSATDMDSGNYEWRIYCYKLQDDIPKFDEDKWTVNSATTSISNSVLEIQGPASGNANVITKNKVFSQGQTMRARFKFGTLDNVKSLGGQNESGISDDYHRTQIRSRSVWTVTKSITTDGSNWEGWKDFSADFASDYHIYEIRRYSGGVKFYVDDNLETTHTTYYLTDDEHLFVHHTSSDTPSYLDWILVRKYVDPEPFFSSAQAEEGPVFTCGDTLANLSKNWWAVHGTSFDIFLSSSSSSHQVEFGPKCSEILSVSESPNAILSLISHSQDTLKLTDLSVLASPIILNAIDSIDVSDGCTLSLSFTSSCLDVLHAIDSASYPLPNVVNCLDSLGTQDSISSFLSMLCQSKDNIGGADGETSQLSVERALLDILAFLDTSSYLAGIIASASDVLNVQDLNSIRLTFSCSSIDVVKNTDSGGVNVTFHLNGNDILKGADFVSGNLQILLDSLAVFKSADQSASSLLGFILRSATDVLDMYDLNTATLQISSSSIDVFRTEDNSSINITLHLNSADVFKNSDSAILSLQALLSALKTLKVSDSSAASLFAEILASASDLLATSDYNGVRLEFLNSSVDVIKSEDRATPSITLHLNSSDILHGLDSVTTKLEAILCAMSEFKNTDQSSTRRQIVHITPVKIFKAQQKILVFKAENI